MRGISGSGSEKLGGADIRTDLESSSKRGTFFVYANGNKMYKIKNENGNKRLIMERISDRIEVSKMECSQKCVR